MADSKKTRQRHSLADLFECLEIPLLRYACRFVKRPEVAQDLVQDAFLKLQSRWEEVADPKPWLYRTIHNLALNYQRKEARILPISEAGSLSQSAQISANEPIPDEHLSRLEAIGQLDLVIKSLSKNDRELLRLKFEEGLSYKSISGKTGLSVGNVGYRLHHIIKSLSSKIQEIRSI